MHPAGQTGLVNRAQKLTGAWPVKLARMRAASARPGVLTTQSCLRAAARHLPVVNAAASGAALATLLPPLALLAAGRLRAAAVLIAVATCVSTLSVGWHRR